MTEYRICARCIMDTSDPEITFDENGVCNHCHLFDDRMRRMVIPPEQRDARLAALLDQIRATSKGRAYDCVIGVSGGVDSTYVAYLCKQWGLRPLAVHFDNGWDSELAVANIEKTLKRLDIDLYTHVVDWEEFRDLQLSFLRASTPDGEVPTDHAISALLYRLAARHGIKHILLGTNVVTEGVMPMLWGYGYFDLRYIRAVHRRFGKARLRTYPMMGLLRLSYYVLARGIRGVPILNYVDYDKKRAMTTIESDLGWIYYGGKHYESIYTRFFQAYMLPRKFNIDKRRAHNSALILSGQMSREHAFQAMAEPLYPDPRMEEEDRTYVVKKLGIGEADFASIMQSPPKTFRGYPNSYDLLQSVKFMRRFFK
ncbi:MAG TPA: N-acetyl sugar amidotransferase [Rhizomicrobium sp.]|jgi:N-acetyl sugar amidotransferase|nr:N-acetyl sugar amidotransferase [Rhizomicrobium sp.]